MLLLFFFQASACTTVSSSPFFSFLQKTQFVCCKYKTNLLCKVQTQVKIAKLIFSWRMTHRSAPGSPSKLISPQKKEVTRYGAIKQADLKFGSEKRFMWQNSLNSNDVVYELPEMTSTRSVIFGSSLRVGMDEENPDNKKRSTGPGSYDFAPCFDHNSEYATKQGTRFACAARQSMALKTPSPGAVYNIEKQYWNGPEKSEGIGFVNAPRQNLYGTSLGANADMFFPKFETGPCITISKRFKAKRGGDSTPGPIYDVHVSVLF